MHSGRIINRTVQIIVARGKVLPDGQNYRGQSLHITPNSPIKHHSMTKVSKGTVFPRGFPAGRNLHVPPFIPEKPGCTPASLAITDCTTHAMPRPHNNAPWYSRPSNHKKTCMFPLPTPYIVKMEGLSCEKNVIKL